MIIFYAAVQIGMNRYEGARLIRNEIIKVHYNMTSLIAKPVDISFHGE